MMSIAIELIRLCALSGGGGGAEDRQLKGLIFIYSCSASLISFEIDYFYSL